MIAVLAVPILPMRRLLLDLPMAVSATFSALVPLTSLFIVKRSSSGPFHGATDRDHAAPRPRSRVDAADPRDGSGAPGQIIEARTLAALLRDPAGRGDAVERRHPWPPSRLVQLMAPRPGDASGRSPAAPATMEGRPAPHGSWPCRPNSADWPASPGAAAGVCACCRWASRARRCFGRMCEDHARRTAAARNGRPIMRAPPDGRCSSSSSASGTRFNLLVAPSGLLPPHLRREIRELYLPGEIAGLVGAVRCHAGRWLALPEPAGAGGPGSITFRSAPAHEATLPRSAWRAAAIAGGRAARTREST
jgi:hypothetical protein